MENLWSPWRSKYIGSFKSNPKLNEESCFVCEAYSNPEFDVENYVITRTDLSFVLLNKYPYNNGHILITPIRHIGEFDELTSDELIDIQFTLHKFVKVLKKVYAPHGFNIGINVGKAAGAGLPGHLHYHLIPRWNADTNFTTTIADLNVISEAMEDSYMKIKNAFLEMENNN